MKRLAGILIAAAAALFAAENDSFLLRNVTVYPVSGPKVENVSLLVKDGQIADIAAKIAAPKGLRVIEGKGLSVYPGMINSATQAGISEISSVTETNDVAEIGTFNPQIRALIAVNPESEHFPVIRANGITSAITMPSPGGGRRGGGGSIIAGQVALIHLDGWTWEDMAMAPSAALHLAFPVIRSSGGRGGEYATMMQQGPRATFAEARRNHERELQELSEFFEQARRYQKAKAAGGSGFKADVKLEAMLPVLDRKAPVMVTAVRERAIREAVQFADRQKIRIILANPRRFGDTLKDIKSKDIPVILGPTLELPLEDDDAYDAEFALPAELHKAGVKFAFGSFNNQFARNLPYQAANAVAYGLPYDEALKAVTLYPAEIWGVAAQYGSIEKGKIADLMVTDGDPLETKTQVKRLFIKGREVDLESKHTKLYKKYMARP